MLCVFFCSWQWVGSPETRQVYCAVRNLLSKRSTLNYLRWLCFYRFSSEILQENPAEIGWNISGCFWSTSVKIHFPQNRPGNRLNVLFVAPTRIIDHWINECEENQWTNRKDSFELLKSKVWRSPERSWREHLSVGGRRWEDEEQREFVLAAMREKIRFPGRIQASVWASRQQVGNIRLDLWNQSWNRTGPVLCRSSWWNPIQTLRTVQSANGSNENKTKVWLLWCPWRSKRFQQICH